MSIKDVVRTFGGGQLAVDQYERELRWFKAEAWEQGFQACVAGRELRHNPHRPQLPESLYRAQVNGHTFQATTFERFPDSSCDKCGDRFVTRYDRVCPELKVSEVPNTPAGPSDPADPSDSAESRSEARSTEPPS